MSNYYGERRKDKEKAVAACIRSDRKDISVGKKLAFSHFFRWTKMSKCKIFDLLYSDVIEKFASDDRVFTQKYVVGKQRISMHLLKLDDSDLDPVEILDFLKKLQEKYFYHSH